MPGAKGRVAVLVYRDNVINCPDVLNTARVWARRGYDVDLMAFDTGHYAMPEFEERNIRLRMARTLYGRLRPLAARMRGGGGAGDGSAPAAGSGGGGFSLGRMLFTAGAGLIRSFQKLEFCLGHALRLLSGGYDLAVACDLPPLIAARLAQLFGGPPFVYHSRELALSWDYRSPAARLAKAAERHCHRRALLAIVQDEARADLLRRDNGVDGEYLLLPNAPLGTWEEGRTGYVQRLNGLPPETTVVLYAGVILPETMVEEIIATVKDWPEEAVLVVHGVPDLAYLPRLEEAASRVPGRVVFSRGLVPRGDVDRLYASAAVGLATYRAIDDNFRYVGQAAGKIFNLMKVGVPVVTNELPGMRELVEESGCGRVMQSPAELGGILRDILADPGAYRDRCRETFPRFEFEKNCGPVVDRIEELLGYIPSGGAGTGTGGMADPSR